MVVRIDGLANIVQERGNQEFFVIRPQIACSMEHLQAVIEGIALGVPLGVLLDGCQGFKPHFIDSKAVDVVGHDAHLRVDKFRLIVGNIGNCLVGSELQDFFSHLGIAGQVARSNGMPQNGGSLPFGGIVFRFRGIEEAASAVGRNKGGEHPAGGFSGNLMTKAIITARRSMFLLELVVHRSRCMGLSQIACDISKS